MMYRMGVEPVALRDVRDVAPAAERVVAAFKRDFSALLDGVDVQHIGATSLPFGRTKGDVDVNARVEEDEFASFVAALGERIAVAQEENWSPNFASFSTSEYELPLGVQVTVIGSPNDFLLTLRDRMRADPSLLQRYDETKSNAASRGAEGYWNAKNAFLQELLSQ